MNWGMMTKAERDAAYNNSAAVANSSALMAELRARGDRLRGEMPQHLDLRYGPAPRAFLVVPMVGAFFIDFINAVIITVCLNIWT